MLLSVKNYGITLEIVFHNLLNANVVKMVYKNCQKSIKVLKKIVILWHTRHRHTLSYTYI